MRGLIHRWSVTGKGPGYKILYNLRKFCIHRQIPWHHLTRNNMKTRSSTNDVRLLAALIYTCTHLTHSLLTPSLLTSLFSPLPSHSSPLPSHSLLTPSPLSPLPSHSSLPHPYHLSLLTPSPSHSSLPPPLTSSASSSLLSVCQSLQPNGQRFESL